MGFSRTMRIIWSWADVRSSRLQLTATAAANGERQRSAASKDTRMLHSDLGYVRPEKRTVEIDIASAATVANTAAKPPDNA